MCDPNAHLWRGESGPSATSHRLVRPARGPTNAYEEYLTRGNPRVTARLPEEPMRVTNWLAGWVDYVFATVLVAGRWLAVPLRRTSGETVFNSAFAPAVGDSFAPRWHEPGPQPQSNALVRAAEIVMLSISFFLAAHLLSGGTSTAVAPNLTSLGLLPEHARAATVAVPSLSQEFTVRAAPATVTPDPAAVPLDRETAALAPANGPGIEAAAAPAAHEPAAPAPAISEPPAPIVAPAPAVVVAPAPAPVAAAPAAPAPGHYLTADEVRAAAIAAGWPSNLLDQVVAVAWCESRFHSGATYLGAQGLMQMMPLWFEPAGLDPLLWHDPVVNLKAALFAYLEHDRITGDPWGPWTCKP